MITVLRDRLSPELLKRLRRGDPSVRVMVHAQRVVRGDLKRRKDHWEGADGWPVSGLRIRKDSGLELDTPVSTVIANATQDGYITVLDTTSPFIACRVEWGGAAPATAFVLKQIVASLHPANGGTQNVARWRCQLYAAARYDAAINQLELAPLGDAVDVVAGPGAGEVTFDYADQDVRPKAVGSPQDGGSTFPTPTTYVVITALQADGSSATNVGWARDSTKASVSGVGEFVNVVIQARNLSQRFDGLYTDTDSAANGTPYIKLEAKVAHAAATATFSTNKPNLGGAPASAAVVEFTVRGEIPVGSSITAQARVGGADPWVTVKDGQTAADVGLAASQSYEMRPTLTPPASGDVTPILTDLGVREVTTVDLSYVASVSGGGWGFDPETLRAWAAEIEITAIQDGERDFRDAITELFATTHIGELWFRIFIGADDLDREHWYHVDDFYPRDQVGRGGALVITAINVLGLLRARPLPKYDEALQKQEALAYANAPIKTAYSDLLTNQIAAAGRNIGALPEDITTLVTKTIEDSDGWTELEAVACLAGGIADGRQGKVDFVDIHGPKGIAAVFGVEDAAQELVTPGWGRRTPVLFVWHSYDFEAREFRALHRAFHGDALTKLGNDAIDGPRFFDEEVSKWIPAPGPAIGVTSITRSGQVASVTTSSAHGYQAGQWVEIAGAAQADYNGVFPIEVEDTTHFRYVLTGSPATPATGTITAKLHLAATVGGRQVQTLGTGMITVKYRAQYPHPELWPGDLVLFRTDRLVAKSPTDDRAIRGYSWVLGIVKEKADVLGTGFDLWVRRYSDILSSSNSVDIADAVVPPAFTGASYTSETSGGAGEVAAYNYRNQAQSLPLGLWRTALYDNDELYLQKNTAVAGDFSAKTDILKVAATGLITALLGFTVQGNELKAEAGVRSEAAAPYYSWRETDQTLPLGLWRTRLEGNVLRIERNTAASGDFSALTTPLQINASDQVTLSGLLTAQQGVAVSGPEDIIRTGAAGTNRLLKWQTAGSNRFILNLDSAAEAGANAGSNFSIERYSDAGAYLGSPLIITRSSGFVILSEGLSVTGGSISAPGIAAALGATLIATDDQEILKLTGANASQSFMSLRNTGTGATWYYFDASNGDLIGGDYGAVGQDNDLTVALIQFGNNSLHLRTSGTTRLAISGTGAADFQGNPVSMGALTATNASGAAAALQYDASNRLDITISSAGVVTYNAVGASALHTFSDDLTIGNLGRFDSTDTPTDLQLLVYHAGATLKWQAESIQMLYSAGDTAVGLLADSTSVAYISYDPGAGAAATLPTPKIVLSAGHLSITVTVYSQADTPNRLYHDGSTFPANFRRFVYEYSTNGVDFTTLATASSDAVVHGRLAAGTTYYYRVKAEDRAGGFSTTSATVSTAAAANSKVTPFGSVVANAIATSYLSGLAADLGILVAGIIQNAVSSPVSVINFGGWGGIPSTAVSVINFENTSIPTGSKFIIDFNTRVLRIKDEQASPITRVEIGELSTGTSDWGMELWGSSGASIFRSWGAQDRVLIKELRVGTIGETHYVELRSTGNPTIDFVRSGGVTGGGIVSQAANSITISNASVDIPNGGLLVATGTGGGQTLKIAHETRAGFAPADTNVQRFISHWKTSESTKFTLSGLIYSEQTAATTHSIQGFEAYTVASHGSGTVALALGLIGNVELTGGGTLTWSRSVVGSGGIVSGGGTITNAAAFYAQAPVDTGAGSIANAYGLYVESVTVGGTTNYAIYTNAGIVALGDSVWLATDVNKGIQFKSGVTGVEYGRLVGAITDATGGSEDGGVSFYATVGGSIGVFQGGVENGMKLGSPTGSYKGNGTLNVAGDIYKNNSAYGNPDFVLEHWATGMIVRFADRQGAASYDRLWPLAKVEAFARSEYTLPRIAQARGRAAGSLGLFDGGDAVLASVEEGYLYLFDHERRIADLERENADLRRQVAGLRN